MVRLVASFPDPVTHRFDKREWTETHGNDNVIIHCHSGETAFPKHWGPLSLKTTFQGREFYVKDQGVFAVESDRFLILNEDAHYSSYIPRNGFAESFTLNFGATFLSFFLAHFTNTTEKLLCDPQSTLKHSVNFFEHLYPMTPQIRRRLHALKHMTKDFKLFIHRIDEEMAFLYENLLKMHSRVIRKIDSIRAQKKSTRDELYRRLHIARDYLDSCYQGTITLENLSMIACLSRYHLLRHFKMCFGITPHQYLMQRRIKEAGILLKTTKLSFSEICGFVGFEDRSSFSRLFKAFYKQTPAQFRRS